MFPLEIQWVNNGENTDTVTIPVNCFKTSEKIINM